MCCAVLCCAVLHCAGLLWPAVCPACTLPEWVRALGGTKACPPHVHLPAAKPADLVIPACEVVQLQDATAHCRVRPSLLPALAWPRAGGWFPT